MRKPQINERLSEPGKRRKEMGEESRVKRRDREAEGTSLDVDHPVLATGSSQRTFINSKELFLNPSHQPHPQEVVISITSSTLSATHCLSQITWLMSSQHDSDTLVISFYWVF